jgi:SagB-type dehydrogenase family enzyme
LDWDTQPDPFRRFPGAPVQPLLHAPLADRPSYDALFQRCVVTPQPLNLASLSRLCYNSLALSAWKQGPGTGAWSLRVNPSSGALHPTEGYLVAGPIADLSDIPAVYHYTPYQHALEQRVTLPPEAWRSWSAALPAQAFFVGLTSIYWRESWKYGERAFRYCHHDVGHAIGAIVFAAAALGWQTQLVEHVGDAELSVLLGTQLQHGSEAEHPDCLLAVYRQPATAAAPALAAGSWSIPTALLDQLAARPFAGTPNRLSERQHPWPVIDEVSHATRYPGPAADHRFHWDTTTLQEPALPRSDRGLSAEQILRQRRSAIDLDGRTTLDRADFYRLLQRTVPSGFPFDVFPWRPRVALAIFVHRVAGLTPGLYLLARAPGQTASLRAGLRSDFVWRKPPDCPDGLDFWLLLEADCREAARLISCQQDIAADGVCSLGMLAEFDTTLREEGPWFYPRLFWETGLIGQVLYLEAEAAGLRGCGIGCFFDDVMHETLGLGDHRWQSLYHFSLGGPREDLRLQTLPPYQHLR